jgi:hypothetical protein
MPVFISYSQKDRLFADTLAANLVKKKHHIWMDRWELNVGDSLIDKIQSALTASSAILVVLSKNSVASEWCKKELNSGLVRELEERKTLLLPCVIDDCEIPLFLKEKMYADFRRDPDYALKQVDSALARVSNPQQGRIESPKFITDWSVDWKSSDDDRWIFYFLFVDHGQDWPYIVLARFSFVCSPRASKSFSAIDDDERLPFIRNVLEAFVESISGQEMTRIITDAFEKSFVLPLSYQNLWRSRSFFGGRPLSGRSCSAIIFLGDIQHMPRSLCKNVELIWRPRAG